MAESLAAEALAPRLRGRFGRDYLYAPRCVSTQRLLPPDAAEGAVAVADEQTEGRGRLGRSWVAPAGTSVLCSLVLRPPVAPSRLPELSLVAGRACAEAIAAVTGLRPTVKLPNDVLVDGRKAAGILAEASDGRIVLGIGINVHQAPEDLPAGSGAPATSLDLASGRTVDRAELLVTLLEHLEARYDEWVARSR
jgi:BirA family biotin operon repressor/biotin-[acetyl-CoA-carboxylase] ligase